MRIWRIDYHDGEMGMFYHRKGDAVVDFRRDPNASDLVEITLTEMPLKELICAVGNRAGFATKHETIDTKEARRYSKCPICGGKLEVDAEYMQDTYGTSYVYMPMEEWAFACTGCDEAGIYNELEATAKWMKKNNLLDKELQEG